MKNYAAITLALLVTTLMFYSCDTNNPLHDEPTAKHPEVNFKAVTFKMLENSNPDPLRKLDQAINIRGNYQHRGANSDNTYVIDSTSVAHMTSDDGFESFTFAVKSESADDFIHNIIVSYNQAGESIVTLAEYGLDATVGEIGGQTYQSHIVSTQFIRLNDPTLLQSKGVGLDYLDLGYCLKVGYWTVVEKCQGELVTPADRPDCFDANGGRTMVSVFIVIIDGCGSNGGNSVGPETPVPPAGPETGNGWPGASAGETTPNTRILTTPILVNRQLLAFERSLNAEIRQWWMFDGDPDAVADFITYLEDNNYSAESVAEVHNMIQDIIDESVNLPTGHPEVGGPAVPGYDNIKTELRCLDRNAPATFTVYIRQPVPGTATPNNGDDGGHAFIAIDQGNIRRVIGFYPDGSVSPIFTSEDGVLANDGGSSYNVKIQFNITPGNLKKVLKGIEDFSTQYDLNTNNCTDFTLKMSRLAGLKIGPAFSNWTGGGGDNPGKLGHMLQNMVLPPGFSMDPTPGVALPNYGGMCP